MKKCYDCTHVEMCEWRKEVKEQGCEFFDDGMVWIPVSERLPDEGQDVLVTVDDNEFNIKVGSCRYSGGVFHSQLYYLSVLAWMPLPEPYKGGDGE